MRKRIWAALLCAVFLLGMPIGVFAAEDEETQSAEAELKFLSIGDKASFLTFAENCRLDSYSQHLEVELTADIDLTGEDFSGVPHFSGTFDGKGHTISGLSITGDGSVQGLFRYLTDTAQVRNLCILGTVQPQGSRSTVGALAGNNAGQIRNCSFRGQVSGGDQVGGLVGVNLVTGLIDGCSVHGQVYGNHFVGGIVGDNQGVVRRSTNNAHVNTTPQQNNIEIEDITLDSLTNTESANTVTDVGGIAGTHSGVLRDCINYGNVGYQRMGYNIGGIAGSHKGYITDCENRGSISGRKEVGGIVGQAEPVTKLEFAQDTLQILQEQLDTMSSLTNQAAANAQSGANNIASQIAVLQSQVEDARDAVDALLPEDTEIDPDDPGATLPQFPDEDAIAAAQNNLSSALSGMQGSLSAIAASAQSTAGNLSSDLQAVAGQVNVMSQTVSQASENLGGTLTDVSDLDTPEDLTGKIKGCVNYGDVLADINTGGIVGAMATENDLDQEENLEVLGDISLNFQGEVRSVVVDCRNEATIAGSKQRAGGIVGWMQLGLVKTCENYGTLECEDADYVGGIAGQSAGFIRACGVNGILRGSSFTGGIAGSGAVVTDCRALVRLTGIEKLGHILGDREQTDQENPVAGNYYLTMESDRGGIDGISYDGCAQSLPEGQFLQLENLPERFRQVIVTFLFEDGSRKQVTLELGQTLTDGDIPAIPAKDGYTARWEELETEVFFDTTFRAEYVPYAQTLQSSELGENGLPVLLAVGAFTPEQTLSLTAAEPELPLKDNEKLLEAWTFEDLGQTGLRCQLPDGADAGQVKVLVRKDGIWQETDAKTEGRYLVLDGQDAQGICLVYSPRSNLLLYGAIAVGVIAAAGCALLIARRRKKKQAKPVSEE